MSELGTGCPPVPGGWYLVSLGFCMFFGGRMCLRLVGRSSCLWPGAYQGLGLRPSRLYCRLGVVVVSSFRFVCCVLTVPFLLVFTCLCYIGCWAACYVCSGSVSGVFCPRCTFRGVSLGGVVGGLWVHTRGASLL